MDTDSTISEGVRLVRLPSGTWIRPASVTAVRVMRTERGCMGDLYRARVAIDYGCGLCELMLANDDEHAVALAASYAARFNGNVEQPAT